MLYIHGEAQDLVRHVSVSNPAAGTVVACVMVVKWRRTVFCHMLLEHFLRSLSS